MKKQYQDLLHQYKVEVFRKEHDQQSVSEITNECLHVTEDVLKQKYHYHFHELADADRAEIINMINNYTREAILPPVIEKLVARQIRIERRFNALVGLTEQLLELLSQQDNEHPSRAKG